MGEGAAVIRRPLAVIVAAAVGLTGCAGSAPSMPSAPSATRTPAPVMTPTATAQPLHIRLRIEYPEKGSRAFEGVAVRVGGEATAGTAVSCSNAAGDAIGATTANSIHRWQVGPVTPPLGEVHVTCVAGNERADVAFRVEPEPVLPTPTPSPAPFVGQKSFTISGGPDDGISRTFRLRSGTWVMRWSARGGPSGSCFGMAWLNTPGRADTDRIEDIFDLYADSPRKRSGREVVYDLYGGKFIVGTITTCRWSVTFVHKRPLAPDTED